MKTIVCPKCGKVNFYVTTATERRYFVFNANGEPQGETDSVILRSSNTKLCVNCFGRVKIIDETERQNET